MDCNSCNIQESCVSCGGQTDKTRRMNHDNGLQFRCWMVTPVPSRPLARVFGYGLVCVEDVEWKLLLDATTIGWKTALLHLLENPRQPRLGTLLMGLPIPL
jgi:hypothetical protein